MGRCVPEPPGDAGALMRRRMKVVPREPDGALRPSLVYGKQARRALFVSPLIVTKDVKTTKEGENENGTGSTVSRM